MFTSRVELRNLLFSLSSAVDKGVATTKDDLRPFFNAAAKFAEDGHTATAERMLEPVRKIFLEWADHSTNLLSTVDGLSRAELKKEIDYHKSMATRLDVFASLREPFGTDAGEEIAFRKNIGQSYSEALCARNELTALLAQVLQKIQRKEPTVLAHAAEAFATFNLIECYGRVHDFEALEKLSVRIKNAHRIILTCKQRVMNYVDSSS
jgi:hypothetical protein